MDYRIRPAVEADVPFIAWVQQEAARSHLPQGFWDLAIPGAEADRLRIVGRIAQSSPQSFCHWSRFLIAEVDGGAAAGAVGLHPAVGRSRQRVLRSDGRGVRRRGLERGGA